MSMGLTLLVVVSSIVIGFVLATFVWPLIRKNKRKTFNSVVSTESISPSENSLRDAITGLYNKNHLSQRLREMIAKADRGQDKLALILWDIDGFVSFNNQFGKKAGDKFLQAVALIIRKTLRAYDEAFRAGPDEFCAILTPCDQQIADEVMQRVSEAVSKTLFENEGEYSGRQFSISSGLVFYPGEQNVPEGLLHAAREDLYKKNSQKKVLAN